MSDLVVTLDNRAKLVGAVLAAGYWTQMEQAEAAHAVHPQSKFTMQFVAPFEDHETVVFVNELFYAGKITITDLFTVALRCQWATFEPLYPLPDHFPAEQFAELLVDYYVDTAVAAFLWADHPEPWDEAVRDLRGIFHNSPLPRLLEKLAPQSADKSINIIPSLTFPMLNPVLTTAGDDVFIVLPPPKAWGESRPWLFREEAEWSLAHVCYQLTQHFLADLLAGWDEVKQETFKHAVVTVFLEKALTEADAKAYLVRSKKQYGLGEMPAFIDKINEFLSSNKTLADFEF